MLPDVKDRQHLLALHKAAKKAGLNLHEYNALKRDIAEIENDIRRLRDPLCLHVPAAPVKAPNYSETEITTAKKLQQLIAQTGVTGETAANAASAIVAKFQKSDLLKLTNLLQKLKSIKK